MPPKAQRRAHTKSKAGCLQCRQRRIKCDETRPVCYSCTRRESTCDFPISPTPARSTPRSREDCITPSERSRSEHHSPLESPIIEETSITGTSDLELLHHYTLVTALDLGDNRSGPSMVDIWQKHMPQLAFRHDFLLKGILTLSALHLGHLIPARRPEFRLKASSLQQAALALFQATLPNLDESNCQALFCFALLLIPISFAMRLTDTPQNSSTVDSLDWVWLIRGGLSILQTHEENFRHSFLNPFLDYANHAQVTPSFDHPYAGDIAVLFEVSRGLEDSEASRACILAAHSLLSTFIYAKKLDERHEATTLICLAWPAHQSEKFMELLSQRNPEALVILAHYCVLVHPRSFDDSWFLGGCAERMLQSIKASLPQPYYRYLQWPEAKISEPK